MPLADKLSLASLLIALVALVISLYSWGTASRAARNDVLAQVRDWGADVVGLLADARSLCEVDLKSIDSSELPRKQVDLRSRASALLDRGRFFFPNRGKNRPQILDLVMVAYELMPGIAQKSADNDRREKAFHYVQIVFVSTVKEAVNFSIAPATMKKYEEHLRRIEAQPLPKKIRQMLANDHGFDLKFDDLSLDKLPARDT